MGPAGRSSHEATGLHRPDAGILRTAAEHNHANVGVYASMLQGGAIHRGDSVSLE
jgi:MOSC domain-containing protein YiiM